LSNERGTIDLLGAGGFGRGKIGPDVGFADCDAGLEPHLLRLILDTQHLEPFHESIESAQDTIHRDLVVANFTIGDYELRHHTAEGLANRIATRICKRGSVAIDLHRAGLGIERKHGKNQGRPAANRTENTKHQEPVVRKAEAYSIGGADEFGFKSG
jgi:hypothetical protein